MDVLWVPLNIIPSVYPLFMILSGIFHYPGPYIYALRMRIFYLVRTCRVQVAAYTRVSGLLKRLQAHCLSTQSVVVELTSRECAESVVFAIYLPLAVRGIMRLWRYAVKDQFLTQIL